MSIKGEIMGLYVGEHVYSLVNEFAMKADIGTEITPADLRHIGDEFDIRASLEQLCLHGLLNNPSPGVFIRLEIGLH